MTRPRRRRRAALFAVLFLLVGVGLLLYSATWFGDRDHTSSVAPGAAPTTTRSPTMVRPTGPADTTSSPVISYVAVPTYVPVPVPAGESGILPVITTVSGLLASLAGIVSAVVSIRGARAR